MYHHNIIYVGWGIGMRPECVKCGRQLYDLCRAHVQATLSPKDYQSDQTMRDIFNGNLAEANQIINNYPSCPISNEEYKLKELLK